MVAELKEGDIASVAGVMDDNGFLKKCRLISMEPKPDVEPKPKAENSQKQPAFDDLPLDNTSMIEYAIRYHEYEDDNDPGLTSAQRIRYLANDAGKRFKWSGGVIDVRGSLLAIGVENERRWFVIWCRLDMQEGGMAIEDLNLGTSLTVEGVMHEGGYLSRCRLIRVGD